MQMNNAIHIQTDHPGDVPNRLSYVAKLVFEQMMGLQIFWIAPSVNMPTVAYKEHFSDYSRSGGSDGLGGANRVVRWSAMPLLFEGDIQEQELKMGKWKKMSVLFTHDEQIADLPFDPLAMIFFLVSRYEEYISNQRDQYGRFPVEASVAYQYNFLDLPLADLIVEELKTHLKAHFPDLKFREGEYQRTLTFDIDYAWAYLHKGWRRTLGAWARDAIKRPHLVPQRLKVVLGLQNDPYFTFDKIDQIILERDLPAIFFFLVGDYATYDKNISTQKPAMRSLIQRIQGQYEVGLHPSFQSNQSIDILKKEKERLEEVTQHPITKSRQHYLKLYLPMTYRQLIEIGIQEDYTMGYEWAGFRASIAQPFYWYDLERDETTPLKIYPFHVMDVALKNYMKLPPNLAKEQAEKIIQSVKAVNGHYIELWHNNSLCQQEGWEGYEIVVR